MKLALCPSCENWQPVLDGNSNEVTRRCVAGIEGAPRVTLCNRFLQAPGRGGIHDWVQPAGDKGAQGEDR